VHVDERDQTTVRVLDKEMMFGADFKFASTIISPRLPGNTYIFVPHKSENMSPNPQFPPMPKTCEFWIKKMMFGADFELQVTVPSSRHVCNNMATPIVQAMRRCKQEE
jgi:hypothetical protein